MPKPASDLKKDALPKELFAQADLLLASVVHFAFLQCHHQPSLEDERRLKQRLSLLLLEDDHRRLRGYDNNKANLETWLQTVANHEASHFLRQERRHVSLDDASSEMFIQPPIQEVLLLDKEQRYLLEKVLPKLTPRQRKVFDDLWQGKTAEETAEEMGIQAASVHRQRDTVKKKIQKLIAMGDASAERKKKIVL